MLQWIKISTNQISSQIVEIVNIANSLFKGQVAYHSYDWEGYISCNVKVIFVYFDKKGFYVGYNLAEVCESMRDGDEMIGLWLNDLILK